MPDNTVWWNLPHPSPVELEQGAALLDEYLQRGFVQRTPLEMLRLPDGVMTHFYRALSGSRSCCSPLSTQPDSAWMVDADFCFINVRATGLQDEPGNFIQAAKVLPCLRASAIHLGPFTDYDFETIYAVRSVRSISPRVVNAALPLSPEDQLRALVQAAHLLGKAIGFDVEPHTAQYAIPVILFPELFRWYQLDAQTKALAGGLSSEAMLNEAVQGRITAEIRAVVQAALQQAGINSLEANETDSAELRGRKQQTYFGLIGTLIRAGFWPIPSQSWAGRGVPAYLGYHEQGNYARFDYRGPLGEDLSGSAFHILTPFKFYSGLLPNREPVEAALFQPAAAYFYDIFPYWRDHFDFDFVRYDSADHIFDSAAAADAPLADRPTPAVLQACIAQSKAPHAPFIGNLAERMGNEIEQYAALGYDLILGDDMLQRADAALVEKSFHLQDRLKALNQNRPQPASIAFCVDTHDTGNPAFWGEPLVKVAGPAQMRLRHFLARFISAGSARRPKYEVIGSQDLSYGLYQSNVREQNLTWVGDADYNRQYHYLEDVYQRYQAVLRRGEVLVRAVQPGYAWWMISDGAQWLIPVVAFAPLESLTLDLAAVSPACKICIQYDFAARMETRQPRAADSIQIRGMAAETARLLVFTDRADD